MSKPFSIAIDGPAGTGKSTVAKAVARALGAMYLDTGAMYRAFGLAILRMGIDPRDRARVAEKVDAVDVDVRFVNGAQHIFLGDEDVTGDIRSPEVSAAASAVSAAPEVRRRMVEMQRGIAAGHSVVMDGRDIGTDVLPNATLKLYMTATAQERARRRYLEMREKGQEASFEQVLRDIEQRDWQDTHREASPLRVAEGAVVLDTTELNQEQVIQRVLDMARQVI